MVVLKKPECAQLYFLFIFVSFLKDIASVGKKLQEYCCIKAKQSASQRRNWLLSALTRGDGEEWRKEEVGLRRDEQGRH